MAMCLFRRVGTLSSRRSRTACGTGVKANRGTSADAAGTGGSFMSTRQGRAFGGAWLALSGVESYPGRTVPRSFPVFRSPHVRFPLHALAVGVGAACANGSGAGRRATVILAIASVVRHHSLPTGRPEPVARWGSLPGSVRHQLARLRWAMTALSALFGFNAVAVRAVDLLVVLGVVLLIYRLAKWGGATPAARWWMIAGAALFYPYTVEMSHARLRHLDGCVRASRPLCSACARDGRLDLLPQPPSLPKNPPPQPPLPAGRGEKNLRSSIASGESEEAVPEPPPSLQGGGTGG